MLRHFQKIAFAHRRRVWVALGAGLAGLVLAAASLEVAVRAVRLPGEALAPPEPTPVLLDVRQRPLRVTPSGAARAALPHSLAEMGEWLPLATVGIEDHRFWTHRGVDLRAVTGAAIRNLRHFRSISGASTITQQLIKMSSSRESRTLGVKMREALQAMKLERNFSKRQILAAYLNRLDYGNRRVGPEAAARAYFGKSARALSLAEAIYLAGLPQAPSRLNPWQDPGRALARYLRNVDRLAARKLFSPDVCEFLLKNPPAVRRHDPPAEAEHFADLVAGQTGRRSVRQTSLDLDLQGLAERALREQLTSTPEAGDAAVIILENATGEVRALACAGSRRHASVNSAIVPRSCGSTLKPFLYVEALDGRLCTAATLLPDVPDAVAAEFRDYDPQNYSGQYRGPVRLREALGNSLNVPAVVTLSRLGARETFSRLRGWGFDFPGPFDAFGAGFILGNAPVRLIELAGAYASLARGGLAWPPRLTPDATVQSRRMASREACQIITDILCDSRARRLSFGTSSPLNLSERTAVKTGTSSGFRDGWCVGFNKVHTVAVWTGNLDGTPMGEKLAVQTAAPLWAAIMNALYAAGDKPVPEIEESIALRRVEVALETGLLPREGEPAAAEWFLAGTEPTENAAAMYSAGVLQLPRTYTEWCMGLHNHLGAAVQAGPLEILFPRDGAIFLFNAALGTSRQMLPLQGSAGDCEWFLNGRKLSEPLVPLQRGTWEVTARRGTETAVARFLVE